MSEAPSPAQAWLDRGLALQAEGALEPALDAYRAAFKAGAGLDAVLKVGVILAALGRHDDALDAFDGVLKLDPNSAVAHYQRGLVRLQLRQFAGGWDDYEARWGAERFVAESRGFVPEALIPELTLRPAAADLAGKRILLIGEQAIGDQVMFASMLPDLARAAKSVTLVCEPRLVRLVSASLEGVASFSPRDAAVDTDAIDRVVAMGSLGAAYRREPADFPGTPYLRPRDEVVAGWAARLGPKRGRRIGLSWRGGAATTGAAARSLGLAQFAPLLALPGCEFVSLQYGDTAAELAGVPAIRSFPRADIEDFEDLAGLVANLDAVVSVQTALVHLCGAIGAPCLTLIPKVAEWRYMAEGETMPWYRSVRLFRQAEAGDWPPVVQAVGDTLAGG